MKLNKSSILIFFFNLNILSAAEKIAFIDLDFVLEKSNLGKSILNEIDELNNNNINELEKIKKELKKNEDEIIAKQNILSNEESQKEINLFKKKIRDFRNLEKEMNLNFKKKRNDILKSFFDQINPIIQNYMDKNSINILLDRKNVFIGKNNSDITNIIIDEINKKLN